MTYSRFSERQPVAGLAAAAPVAEGGTVAAPGGVARVDALPVPAVHLLDGDAAR